MKTFLIGLLFGGIATVGGTQVPVIMDLTKDGAGPATMSCAIVSDDVFQFASFDHSFKDVDCIYENGGRTIVGPTCSTTGSGWAAHMEGYTDICEGARRTCTFTCETPLPAEG